MLAALLAARGSDVPTRALRFVDPGQTPLGSAKPIGVGTVAKVVTETRQVKRAREREALKLAQQQAKRAARGGGR